LPNVTFTSMPKNMQVYPRNLQTDMANVTIAGSVNDPGYDGIAVHVTRNGAACTNMTQSLTYLGGQAAFSQTAAIFSELANYNFTVSLIQAEQTNQVAAATNVVAGDILLVNGQSNAEAMQYSGSANGSQSQWVRSFGSRAAAPQGVAADLEWRIAEGDLSQDPAAIGQWPLKMGRLIVDTYQFPVAIINEAYPGQPIGYFTRNNANPFDLSTNYGCLLYRVQQAGASAAVRAILWYQGESDNDNAAAQETGFLRLYRNWQVDYPSLEKIYVHQIRPGCPADKWATDLRNRQRLYADKFPDIEVMSTTGVDGQLFQSGLGYCHFVFTGGYETIANHIFGVVGRDLYGASASGNLDAPNPAYAYYSKPGHNEITILTREATDSITFQSGAAADFRVEGSGATVTNGNASGHTIVLFLNGDGSNGTGVSYAGHAGAGPWVVNSTGVGLLNFYNQMINLSSNTAPNAPVGLSASLFSATELDLKWSATTNAVYYIILRDGVQIGTTYDTAFYDTNFSSGSNYAYSVQAVGLSSTSAPSDTVTAPGGTANSTSSNIIAADSAGDFAYSNPWPYQWISGDNGGVGFGPWTLTAYNTGGFYVGDSTQNGFIPSGGINVLNTYNSLNLSWGLWANSSTGPAEIFACRPFNSPLGVGQTFEIFVDTGWNDGVEGFVLRSGNITTNKNVGERFEFLHTANNNYSIFGAVYSNTAVGWTDGGVKVDFTLMSMDTYSITISGLVSGASQTITGALQGISGSSIDSVALFDENINSASPNFDLYFNSMSIISEPRITSIQLLQGTNAVLRFSTAPVLRHSVQATSDLTSNNWSTVVSNVPGTGGFTQITNSASPASQQQFYRVRMSGQ
jgi:Carbohydrate esterase, sialic acid-specific acetylesterase